MHCSFTAVAVVVGLVAALTSAQTASMYVVVQSPCVYSSFPQVGCDENPAKVGTLIYDRCAYTGSYLAYITSDEELTLAVNALKSTNISRAYVGGYYSVSSNYWYWMADGWGYQGASIFSVGGADVGGLSYGSDYWKDGYPVTTSGNFMALDVTGNAGFINVGGSDVLQFYILCEAAKRDPPVFQGSPSAPGGTATPMPTTSPPSSVEPSPSNSPGPGTDNSNNGSVRNERAEFPIWVIGLIIDVVILVVVAIVITVYCYCCRKKEGPGAHTGHSSPKKDPAARESLRSPLRS